MRIKTLLSKCYLIEILRRHICSKDPDYELLAISFNFNEDMIFRMVDLTGIGVETTLISYFCSSQLNQWHLK